jgi:uncharacterized protein YodC (DUF2158 family)
VLGAIIKKIKTKKYNMGQFIKGNVVRLKSGGPDMTIARVLGIEKDNAIIEMADSLILGAGYENGDLICEWFEKTTKKDGVFKASSVELIKE